MYGIKDLKEKIKITETNVECPIKGCNNKVERQRKVFKCEDRFFCREHNIYISPSTFEYKYQKDNILFNEDEEIRLLEKIYKSKRESRIKRDRSEDAVTWNVFRFLERNNLLESVFESILSIKLDSPEMIYWSHQKNKNVPFRDLIAARKLFDERMNRGSEPDIIIKTKTKLIFLEAKFTSGNCTSPSENSNLDSYETNADNWFNKVFNSSIEDIAINEKKYELMRFWLIGTWIAIGLGLDFHLINLVRDTQEKNIVDNFSKHIKKNQNRNFCRMTWESIYNEIENKTIDEEDKNTILHYFKNKTLGFGNGKLKKAFSLKQ